MRPAGPDPVENGAAGPGDAAGEGPRDPVAAGRGPGGADGVPGGGRTAAGRALFFGALPAAVWTAGWAGAVPPPLRGGEPDNPDL